MSLGGKTVKKIALNKKNAGWFCGTAKNEISGEPILVFSEDEQYTSHYILLMDVEMGNSIIEDIKRMSEENNYKYYTIDVDKSSIVRDKYLSIDSFHKYGLSEYTDRLMLNRPTLGNA